MSDLRQSLLTAVRLVVVKVGTRVLTGGDGLLDLQRIESLGGQIHRLIGAGLQVVLVSSGAVGAGMGRLGLVKRPQELARLQAVAAVGQSCLIEAYDRVLRGHGRHAAQVLLVADDLKERSRYLNIRNTLRSILAFEALPIVNENDTVSTEELRTSFGDNDRLAAQVATLVSAEVLILLSDVDGLFDRHPGLPGAVKLDTIDSIDRHVEALACDGPTGLSKGGMASKIAAARIATESGCHCIIASGKVDRVLDRVMAAESVGTFFPGRSAAMPAWKRWLGWSADSRGVLTVDAGARRAVVERGSSLLAAGVRAVQGVFGIGDVVSLGTANDGIFARGLVNYPSDDLVRVAGLRTDQIAAVLGHCPYDEVVHRDNLAVISRDTSGGTASC